MPSKFINKICFILLSLLLFFAIAFISCFALLFTQYADRVESNRMESKALALADSLGKITPDTGITSIYNNDTMYLLNSFNQNEVWLIDKNTLQISGSKLNPALKYEQLTPEMQNVINDILSGSSIRTKAFASVTNADYSTIGVPVYDKHGQVKAALLLHDKLPTLQLSWYNGIGIMIFTFVIVLLSSLWLLRRLLRKYTLPLNPIIAAVNKFTQHDYTARIDAGKNFDEISRLARSINELGELLQNVLQRTLDKTKDTSALLTESSVQLSASLSEIENNLAKIKTEESKAELENARHNCKSMVHALSCLEYLNEVSGSRPHLNTKLMNLLEILDKSTVRCRKSAESKQISISTRIDIGSKVILFSGDADKLGRMFYEAINKALFLYPSGTCLTISAEENSSSYFICIRNTAEPGTLPQPADSAAADEKSLSEGVEYLLIKKLASVHGIFFACKAEPNRQPAFKFVIEK